MEIERNAQQIWQCKIGECDVALLPRGADAPMRKAIADAYFKLTGVEPTFIFSGWNETLTEYERAIVEKSSVEMEK